MVGCHEVGGRDRPVAEEGVDAGFDVDAGVDVAQHRIAAPDRARIGRPHAACGIEDDVGQGGIADIAGQQAIAPRELAQRLDALDDLGDLLGRGRATAPGAVARVV